MNTKIIVGDRNITKAHLAFNVDKYETRKYALEVATATLDLLINTKLKEGITNDEIREIIHKKLLPLENYSRKPNTKPFFSTPPADNDYIDIELLPTYISWRQEHNSFKVNTPQITVEGRNITKAYLTFNVFKYGTRKYILKVATATLDLLINTKLKEGITNDEILKIIHKKLPPLHDKTIRRILNKQNSNGWIYVAKTVRNDKVVMQYDHLYKIGKTKVHPKTRVSKGGSTFLFAAAKIVDQRKFPNIDAAETNIHALLNNQYVKWELVGSDGRERYNPEEWFNIDFKTI